MSTWLVGTGVAIYLATAADQAMKGGWWQAGMWFCYACANLCIMQLNK